MGLTFDQAKSLGIGHLHPAACGGKSRERELLDSLDLPPPSKMPSDGMNKTERAFSQMLALARYDCLILDWRREPCKFQLAGNTTYTPDFGIDLPFGVKAYVEIKGFMRDDAAVKLKVAASQYPCFIWLLVVRSGRHNWGVREVTETGIARAEVNVDWIRGTI